MTALTCFKQFLTCTSSDSTFLNQPTYVKKPVMFQSFQNERALVTLTGRRCCKVKGSFSFQCPLRQDHNGAKKSRKRLNLSGSIFPNILRKSAINVTDIKSEALYAGRNLSGLEKNYRRTICVICAHAHLFSLALVPSVHYTA